MTFIDFAFIAVFFIGIAFGWVLHSYIGAKVKRIFSISKKL